MKIKMHEFHNKLYQFSLNLDEIKLKPQYLCWLTKCGLREKYFKNKPLVFLVIIFLSRTIQILQMNTPLKLSGF